MKRSMAIITTGSAAAPGSDRSELEAVVAAARSHAGVVVTVLTAAGLAWWSTANRMATMNAEPGTSLGGLGRFMGVWVVMMGAMMLPSLAPTAAVVATRARRREPSGWLLFVAGYLLVWSAAGAAAYGVLTLGHDLLGPQLAWHRAGRWLAAGVLALAALYELTPPKHTCLSRCRSPERLLCGPSHDRRAAALVMGASHGTWCLGCSWGLMGALFALGMMSITWMAIVATVLAAEKLLPRPRAITIAAAVLFLALALGVVATYPG